MERTCGNGTLRAIDAGKKVTLIGWVSKRRNLGSLVFIDLRDRTGTVQVTFDETMAEKVKDVRNEYILSVTGTVTLRKDANPKMETGEIEIHCEDVTIVNSAETLPIDLSDNSTSFAEDSEVMSGVTQEYLDAKKALRKYTDELDRINEDALGFSHAKMYDIYGDSVWQGPLWVRPTSLIEDMYNDDIFNEGYHWTQIVGHTRTKNGKPILVDSNHNILQESLQESNDGDNIILWVIDTIPKYYIRETLNDCDVLVKRELVKNS